MVDTLSYSSDVLLTNHSKLVVIFFFHFCVIYFLPFQNIFKDSQKKKDHFKKITVSRQFSVCEIGNFGRYQLRDMGRIQWFHVC